MNIILLTFHLNRKCNPWGLIIDMQMIYTMGNTGTHRPIDFTLYFKGDCRPTLPPLRVSRVPDYLYSVQSVLGLFQVRLIPHTLL